MKKEYPFSAVVGEDDLKIALLLVAIDPTIGGVLIKGERGAAKSTVARGLAALLPADAAGESAPFVELPLGATEDRVVGSLDVRRALREGETQLRSGLLARADGGILYVDEVNLLPDHLVDLLLDAAARGWVTVERDGVSAGESASFVLIGTMNPEEGELRPQFLDRFGLSVQVQGLSSPQLRAAALARRLAFDVAPSRFVAEWQTQENDLRRSIVNTRARLLEHELTETHLLRVADMCIEQGLDGIRGDLAVIRTARALAAWEGGACIEEAHIRRAWHFAVPHRMHRRPDTRRTSGSARQLGVSSSAAQPDLRPAPPTQQGGTVNLIASAADRDAGRRSSISAAARRAPRAEPYDETGTFALSETLTLAAARGARVGEAGVSVSSADLLQHCSEGPGRSSVLFVVDASGSMAAQRRLAAAKGAALAMLRCSYRHRDEVALMVFRGTGTDLVLPFTSDIERIESALREVPTGGRTPLARALLDAAQLLNERRGGIVVLFTDGRANVSLTDAPAVSPEASQSLVGEGDSAWNQALGACSELAARLSAALVVDCEMGPVALGRARLLADVLGGECIALHELEVGDLTLRLQRKLARP